MSDPARHLSPPETGGRPTSAPLRDWLAAMKAHAPAPRGEARPESPAPRVEAPGWAPRLVQPSVEAAPPPEAEDISELMAENLMLKAKLRLETERQNELQTLLAQELRDLRAHVASEMGALQEIRAEHEQVQAERDRIRAERDAVRGEYDAMREERDLWRARSEALAQPLFQKR